MVLKVDEFVSGVNGHSDADRKGPERRHDVYRTNWEIDT